MVSLTAIFKKIPNFRGFRWWSLLQRFRSRWSLLQCLFSLGGHFYSAPVPPVVTFTVLLLPQWSLLQCFCASGGHFYSAARWSLLQRFCPFGGHFYSAPTSSFLKKSLLRTGQTAGLSGPWASCTALPGP